MLGFLKSLAMTCALLLAGTVGARTLVFEIDTAPLAGQPGSLAFDLVSGGAAPINTVSITAFSGNATLGTATFSGAVTGTLVPGPVTLSSSQFFNEFLQPVEPYGSSLLFRIDTTEVYTAGDTPDAFSFYLLNSTGVAFATTDPSGANALLALDLMPHGALRNYDSAFASVTVVPEPSSLAMMLLGLAVVGVARRMHLPLAHHEELAP